MNKVEITGVVVSVEEVTACTVYTLRFDSPLGSGKSDVDVVDLKNETAFRVGQTIHAVGVLDNYDQGNALVVGKEWELV